MSKKLTRKIPSMVITVVGDGRANIDSLCANETFARAVFKEAIEGIKDALTNKRQSAILFEVDKSEYYVELEKTEWKQVLQVCLDKHIEKEDYEKCSEIKLLIDKIN